MKLATKYCLSAFSFLFISSSSCSKKDKETVEDSIAAEAISDNSVTSVVALGTTKVTAAPGALAVGSEFVCSAWMPTTRNMCGVAALSESMM